MSIARRQVALDRKRDGCRACDPDLLERGGIVANNL
jgi:hypothetical protein